MNRSFPLSTALLLGFLATAWPGTPPAGDMLIEDFSDIVTPLDRTWNDFSGNRLPINPGCISLGLRVSQERSALNLQWDFRGTNNPPDIMTGFSYSLFGMYDTETTFDGATNVFISFPEHVLDMDNLDGPILEPGGSRSATAILLDVARRGTNPLVLRVELRDVNGRYRWSRLTIQPAFNVQQVRWDFRDPGAFKTSDAGDVDLHAVKQLAILVERHHAADDSANPEQGSFDIYRLAIENDRPQPRPATDEAWMDLAERRACQYFFDWSSRKPASAGIPQDRSAFGDLLAPGFAGYALPACIIAAERKWMSHHDAATNALRIIRVLDDESAFGPEPVGRIGYHGWFYHYLGVDARRKLNFDYKNTPAIDESLDTVEIDPADTAILLMGVLAAQSYFQQEEPEDLEIRRRAQYIFDRVDWPFMLDLASMQFHHGWKPGEKREGPAYEIRDTDGSGFFAGSPGHPELYDAYSDRTLLLTLLSSGWTEHQTPAAVWCSWNRELDAAGFMRSVSGSLASYQLLHAFIDTRALHTPPCADQPKIDWFENSRTAMLHAMGFARKTRFTTYGPDAWGISGTEGPFEVYHDYGLRELSLTNHGAAVEDGTVTYSAMICGASFGDDLKERAISAMKNAWIRGHWHNRFGLVSAFNDDISQAGLDTEGQKFDTIFRKHGPWVQHTLFASQEGPMLLHLENARSGLIWQLLARNLNIQRAFERLSAPPELSLEAERGEGSGRIIQRSQAHGAQTVQLMPQESRTLSFEITTSASYLLTVRYSNDSYGPPEKIETIVDGASIGIFKAFDTSQYVGTGSYGSGWNVFVSNEPMGPIVLQPGVHTVTLSVRSGDAHGVEIDSVNLKKLETQASGANGP